MKRKRSFESDNKKITEIKQFHLGIIPHDIWNYIGKFLNGNNIINMGPVSRFYVGTSRRWMINSYKNELNKYGYQFKFDSNEIPSLESLKNYRDLVLIKKSKYYTLVDRSYAKFFDLIESKDFESAKNFINRKILNQATDHKQKNITDMVFFQKNALGQSAIMIARDLGQQDFLDFCFKNLILNGPDLNRGKYSLIETEDLETVLDKLASGADMSVEALWMFACAYVCNQKMICDEFFKRNWKKTLTATIDGESDVSSSISLLTIATLLGCIDLAKYVMSDINEDECRDQINSVLSLDDEDMPLIYCNSEASLPLDLLDLAAMSKNIKFIDYLISELKMGGSIELAAFYLEQKNLTEFGNLTASMSESQLNYPIILKSRYFNVKIPHNSLCLSLLGIAVAQNWPEAVNLLVTRGAFLNGQFESLFGINVPVPLNIAIDLGYYDMAVLLLKLGANPDSIDNYRYSDIPDAAIADLMRPPGSFCSDLSEPSALTCAIHQGNLNFIQLLLQYGVSLRRETHNKSDSFTFPLIIAIYSNNLAIVDVIIKVIGVEEALNQLLGEYKKKQKIVPILSKWKDPISRNKYKMWKLKNVSDNLLQEFPCFQSKYTLK
jgi:ankyrin repeat protein